MSPIALTSMGVRLQSGATTSVAGYPDSCPPPWGCRATEWHVNPPVARHR
jgi:hypothetical protein